MRAKELALPTLSQTMMIPNNNDERVKTLKDQEKFSILNLLKCLQFLAIRKRMCLRGKSVNGLKLGSEAKG